MPALDGHGTHDDDPTPCHECGFEATSCCDNCGNYFCDVCMMPSSDHCQACATAAERAHERRMEDARDGR